jgi:hypothetical protein
MKRFAWLAVLALACGWGEAFAANLLRNGSFEATPCATPCAHTQGVLPSDWTALPPRSATPDPEPDTYSNDGSYGLSPQDYGNFTGVTAQDGLRWVAGWSLYGETFGQELGAPLVPGHRYILSAYLRQAVRSDLANSGAYQVELWSDPTGAAKVVLGSFAPTTGQLAWEQRTLAFVAPPEAASYMVIAFVSMASGRGAAYPGIDNLVLQDASTLTGVDSDGDGIPDDIDACPASDYSPRVIIDGCETGVVNRLMPNGCTLTDQVRACGAAANHGEFMSCVAALTNSLRKTDAITGLEKGQIQSCAAQSRVP